MASQERTAPVAVRPDASKTEERPAELQADNKLLESATSGAKEPPMIWKVMLEMGYCSGDWELFAPCVVGTRSQTIHTLRLLPR